MPPLSGHAPPRPNILWKTTQMSTRTLNRAMSRSRPVPEAHSKVVPRAMLVGTPLVPRTALPGSPSETLAQSVSKSSYGIGAVSKAVCPNKFVLDQTSNERVPVTPRSQQGIHAHKKLLKGHVKQDYDHLNPSTDEEEAAILFTYIPRRIKNLIDHGIVGEFPVFGYLHDRPFTGSIDEVTLDKSQPNPTVLVNELKTTVTGFVKEFSKKAATRQATLYLYFLRQMMDKTRPFEFGTYFRARGLDPTRRFGSEYAMELLDRMPAGMRKSMSSIDPKPINLRDLGERWNHYIRGLPEFIFPDHTLLTVVRLSQISKVAGFAKFGRPTTTKTPYNIREVLEDVKDLLDIIDGHKAMRGPPAALRAFCNACRHRDSCSVRLEPPLENQISWAPSNVTTKLPPAKAADVYKRWRVREAARKRSGFAGATVVTPNRAPNEATVAAANLYEWWATRFSSKQSQEKEAARKRSTPVNVDKPSDDSNRRQRISSNLKVQLMYAAHQRRALRQQLKSRRDALLQSGDSDVFTGVVPYSTPTLVNFANIVPVKTNDKRGRLRRRVRALQASSQKGLPQHDIFSLERLASIPKFDKDTWKYQFDTKADADDREKLSDISVEPQDAGQPTDVEREAEEREARRAKRRREREGQIS